MPKAAQIITDQQRATAIAGYHAGKTYVEIALEVGLTIGVLSSLFQQMRAADINLPIRSEAERQALAARGRELTKAMPRRHSGRPKKKIPQPLDY